MGYWQNFKNGWFNLVEELTTTSTDVKKTKKTIIKVNKNELSNPPKKIVKKIEPSVPEINVEEASADEQKEYETKIDPPQSITLQDEYIETPEERLARIRRVEVRKNHTMSAKRRQMLFINPGTEKIEQCIYAIKNNGALPDWATRFTEQLSVKGDILYFENLPMVTKEQKRNLIKKEYFHPAKQSTIKGILDDLKVKYANISRANVTQILKSIETYQLNFARRHPPKIMGRMILKTPGIIACDMFFPQRKNGWEKSYVLVMADCYSRFVKAYNVERKSFELVEQAMLKFVKAFLSTGHLIKHIICDKGTDLAPAKKIMEKFRNGRSGPLVFHTKTGQPVNLIEQINAQIQRRLQVFATSGLIDNPGLILEQVCDSINNLKRPIRGNLTPIEILRLDKAGRNDLNTKYKIADYNQDGRGLRELFIGSHVRTLQMTIKEQNQNKIKGFAPKWSRDVYTVSKKRALQGNPDNFKYYVSGLTDGFYRHELLWVPKETDTNVYDFVSENKDATIYEDFSE